MASGPRRGSMAAGVGLGRPRWARVGGADPGSHNPGWATVRKWRKGWKRGKRWLPRREGLLVRFHNRAGGPPEGMRSVGLTELSPPRETTLSGPTPELTKFVDREDSAKLFYRPFLRARLADRLVLLNREIDLFRGRFGGSEGS